MKFYRTTLMENAGTVLKAEVSFLHDYKGEASNFLVAKDLIKDKDELSKVDKTPKVIYVNKTLKEVLAIEYENLKDIETDDNYSTAKCLVVMEVPIYSKKGGINILGLNNISSDYTLIIDKPLCL